MADEPTNEVDPSKSAGEPTPRRRKRTSLNVENLDASPSTPPELVVVKKVPRVRAASARKKASNSPKVPQTQTTIHNPETVVVMPTPNPIRPGVSASTAAGIPAAPDSGGPVAEAYIEDQIHRARTSLRVTMLAGTVFVIAVAAILGYITEGFASSLEPTEAATITQGIVQTHLDDYIPELKRQIKEQTPIMIAKVPDYAKQQLPRYRVALEDRLAKGIQDYSTQTAPQLETDLKKFLADNKDSVHVLVLNGQDAQATATIGTNMKGMFIDYLSQTQVGGETLKSKIDSALSELTSVDARVGRLAANKNLTENEKRARRAISVLLRSVDENPDLKQAAGLVQSIDTTPMNGTLQFKSEDEAVFQAPGKPPMVFVRKKAPPPLVPPLKPSESLNPQPSPAGPPVKL